MPSFCISFAIHGLCPGARVLGGWVRLRSPWSHRLNSRTPMCADVFHPCNVHSRTRFTLYLECSFLWCQHQLTPIPELCFSVPHLHTFLVTWSPVCPSQVLFLCIKAVHPELLTLVPGHPTRQAMLGTRGFRRRSLDDPGGQDHRELEELGQRRQV